MVIIKQLQMVSYSLENLGKYILKKAALLPLIENINRLCKLKEVLKDGDTGPEATETREKA